MNGQKIRILKFISVLFLFFSLSCSERVDEQQYSIIPEIQLKDLYFIKGGNYEPDTLMLKISFTDGDADFGLDGSFRGPPYNHVYYFLKADGDYLTYSDRNVPPYDTLPPFEFPYYCYNYSIEWIDNSSTDTFYVQENKNFYNLFVEYLKKKNGEFELFDFKTAFPPSCGENYYGRVNVINAYGINPKSGNVTYPMLGVRLEAIFKYDTLKLVLQIQDRALHKSNIIETQEFTLQGITKD